LKGSPPVIIKIGGEKPKPFIWSNNSFASSCGSSGERNISEFALQCLHAGSHAKVDSHIIIKGLKLTSYAGDLTSFYWWEIDFEDGKSINSSPVSVSGKFVSFCTFLYLVRRKI
jgi:hypothetical protein